jgi:hypothetical protein
MQFAAWLASDKRIGIEASGGGLGFIGDSGKFVQFIDKPQAPFSAFPTGMSLAVSVMRLPLPVARTNPVGLPGGE